MLDRKRSDDTIESIQKYIKKSKKKEKKPKEDKKKEEDASGK